MDNGGKRRVREVAIVVRSLDGPSAEALLARLSPDMVRSVRDCVERLNDVTPEEEVRVLREFLVAGGHVSADGGLEVSPSLARQLGIDGGRAERTGRASDGLFEFLREASTEALSRRLEQQHPQVVAIVIAHMPPARAAELLTHFPSARQVEVLRHVTQMQDADPTTVESVASELRTDLEAEIQAERKRKQGLALVTSIVNAAGGNRRELLASLARHGGEMFAAVESRLQPRPPAPAESPARGNDSSTAANDPPNFTPRIAAFTSDAAGTDVGLGPSASTAGEGEERADFDLDFEDLRYCDDRGLALLLRVANPRIALLALAGASPRLIDRISHQLPAREARSLRRKMEQLGPLRLDDIRQAQEELARLAKQLIAAGRLQLPPNGRFAAAA